MQRLARSWGRSTIVQVVTAPSAPQPRQSPRRRRRRCRLGGVRDQYPGDPVDVIDRGDHPGNGPLVEGAADSSRAGPGMVARSASAGAVGLRRLGVTLPVRFVSQTRSGITIESSRITRSQSKRDFASESIVGTRASWICWKDVKEASLEASACGGATWPSRALASDWRSFVLVEHRNRRDRYRGGRGGRRRSHSRSRCLRRSGRRLCDFHRE